MKKLWIGLLCATSCILSGCGCSKEEIKISAKNAKTDIPQLIFFENGSMQSTIVESFDKDIYDVEEAKEMASTELTKENTTNSTDIKLNSIEKINDKLIEVFDFSKVEDYTKSSCVGSINAKFLNAKDAKSDTDVPDKLTVYGKKKKEKKKEAIDDDYKTIVLSKKVEDIFNKNEKYEVTVDGDIEYISNAEKVDDNTVRVKNGEEKAIIVFEP